MIDRYPNSPGHRGIETSVAVAEAIEPVTGYLRKKVLAAIRAAGGDGLTNFELPDRVGIEFASVQPRTSELRRLGQIRDSGRRRLNAGGRNVIVWVAVGGDSPAGEAHDDL